MFIKHFIYSLNWSLLLFSPEPIKIDKDEDTAIQKRPNTNTRIDSTSAGQARRTLQQGDRP